MNDAPIGIFDSGVGGLTVARSVLEQLPHERIIYIGDTAHLPYGSKSIDEVRAYAFAIMDALIARDVKLLVIACNTATSAVMEEAQRRYSVPIIGVIDPAAQIAAAVTRNGKVGVIATEATVRSGAYNRALSLYPGVEVTSQACPRFVEMVESDHTAGADVIEQVQEYLLPLQKAEVDTLILGCTHYPLLKGAISYVMGPTVNLVSSSDASAESIYRYITDTDQYRDPQAALPTHEFMTTGPADMFSRLASRFIGPAVGTVTMIGDQLQKEGTT